jgi:hypothetical protein
VCVCVCVCVCVFSSKDCLARNHIEREVHTLLLNTHISGIRKLLLPPILNLFHTHKLMATGSSLTTQNSVSCQHIYHLCDPKVQYRVYDSPPLHHPNHPKIISRATQIHSTPSDTTSLRYILTPNLRCPKSELPVVFSA